MIDFADDFEVSVGKVPWRDRLVLNTWRSPLPYLLWRWGVYVTDLRGDPLVSGYWTRRGAVNWVDE